MARQRGMRPEGVALFHFGAVAWFEDDPPRASDEWWVALAGPAVNLLIATVMVVLWWRLYQTTLLPLLIAAEIALFLAQMNVTLLLFNLLPVYPLDGGRALHGLLWAITKDPTRGMLATAYLSQGLAFLLFLGGSWLALRYHQGLLLFGSVALSWFMYRGSKVALEKLTVRRRLGSWLVEQIMWRESPLLHPTQTLQEASVLMTLRGESVLPVVEDGEFVGILTHTDLQPISHQARADVRVATAMRVAADLPSLAPADRVDVALRRMERARLPALPVLEVGRLVGLLRHYDLARAMQMGE
ncbi:MAG: CBS domain-containing protein [Ardenticatenales bacterium]|nr:CBS domain-containing protein [Ardenticatenales bacterium]